MKRKIIPSVVAMMLFSIMVGSGTVSAAALVETDDSFRGQPVSIGYTFSAPVDLGSNTYSGSIGDVSPNRDRTDHLRFNLPAGSMVTAGFYQTTGGPKGISFWSYEPGQPSEVVDQGGTYNFNATELTAINGAGFLDVVPFDLEGGVAGDKNTYTIGMTVGYLVTIDIKPCSDPNSINLRSKGVLPVAVLTTDDFDATNVNPTTVELDGVPAIKSEIRDVCVEQVCTDMGCEDIGDGDLDLLVYFSTPDFETVWDEDTVEATLTGEDYDGALIQGMNSVRIVTKGPHN
ncbi:hypothetical protein ACFLWZ_00445 [Chloroflexota bacterium]